MMDMYDKEVFSLVTRLTVMILSLAFLTIIYGRNNLDQRREFVFSYLLIGIITFFLCFSLHGGNLNMGLALGLFAIFGILRYRTDTIPVKEMSYLFVAIGISVFNALMHDDNVLMLVLPNSCVVVCCWIFEMLLFKDIRKFRTKVILYDDVRNIDNTKQHLIIQDLVQRTGLDIQKIEIRNINYLNDSAEIVIFYK